MLRDICCRVHAALGALKIEHSELTNRRGTPIIRALTHTFIPRSPNRYKPEFYYWESVVLLFKLILMVGLVFTETGTLYQHAAVVIVCAIQLIVHARAQPYITWTENALQYLGTFWTFAMSFGGMLLQNLKVSQKEAAQRLFGKEAEDTMVSYDYSIQSVEEAITVIMVLVIISAVGVLAYEQWEKRQESKATLGKLGGKMKQCISKLAACCGCGTADVRNSPEAEVELPTIDMDHPNPMYGQHGRAMQASEGGGIEAAAHAVSAAIESKSFSEAGGLNVEVAPRPESAAFESSRVMPSATRVSGIKKK